MLIRNLYLIDYNYSPKQCDPDYYRFSLLKKNGTFLIHGLWIEECSQCTQCGYPSFCNQTCDPSDFNVTELAPLFPRLAKYWYPANNPKVNPILAHEWCKHGTCTNMTMLDYFNTSLNIYDTLVSENLLDLCDPQDSQCYFILDNNLHITNSTHATRAKRCGRNPEDC